MVGADKMSSIIDYTDRATCVLFGDGAAAVLLEPNARRLRHHGHADPLRWLRHEPFLHQKAGGSRMPPTAETVAKRLHYVHQEGAQVYKFAIAGMAEVAREIMARNNLTRRHDRLGRAASGQPPHHRDRRPSAWACRWTK